MPSARPSSGGLRERVEENDLLVWFVLDADRWLVSTVFLAPVFGVLVVAGTIHPTPAHRLLAAGSSVASLFNALVTSTITGVTLVIILSQLVLSQELGAVGDQRERMAGAVEFQDEVGAIIDGPVAPTDPATVLQALLSTSATAAGTLQESATSGALPNEASGSIRELVEAVQDDAAVVEDQLEGAAFGRFEVVRAALNYNYSWKLHAARRIETRWGARLDEPASDALGTLIDTLELFGPAREHFKTLYFQWELSALSRTLIYAAIPALVAAIGGLVLLDPQAIPGATLGVNDALIVLAALTTIAVAPFAVLLAYILRIVTVTKHTLSIGPFILRTTDREPTLRED